MDSDQILFLKEFVPRVKCDDFIKTFESSSNEMQVGTIGQHDYIDFSIKKCSEFFYNFYDKNQRTFVNQHLPLAVKIYRKKHPFINSISSFDISPPYKLQRYYPTEAFFHLHCENDYSDSSLVLAWMIYLNDVTDGGHTEFPIQGKKFQPRAGDLLMWPAYFTHPHRGIPSKTQTKYIMTGWCEYLS